MLQSEENPSDSARTANSLLTFTGHVPLHCQKSDPTAATSHVTAISEESSLQLSDACESLARCQDPTDEYDGGRHQFDRLERVRRPRPNPSDPPAAELTNRGIDAASVFEAFNTIESLIQAKTWRDLTVDDSIRIGTLLESLYTMYKKDPEAQQKDPCAASNIEQEMNHKYEPFTQKMLLSQLQYHLYNTAEVKALSTVRSLLGEKSRGLTGKERSSLLESLYTVYKNDRESQKKDPIAAAAIEQDMKHKDKPFDRDMLLSKLVYLSDSKLSENPTEDPSTRGDGAHWWSTSTRGGEPQLMRPSSSARSRTPSMTSVKTRSSSKAVTRTDVVRRRLTSIYDPSSLRGPRRLTSSRDLGGKSAEKQFDSSEHPTGDPSTTSAEPESTSKADRQTALMLWLLTSKRGQSLLRGRRQLPSSRGLGGKSADEQLDSVAMDPRLSEVGFKSLKAKSAKSAESSRV